MHRRILTAEKRSWYFQDLFLPLGAASLSAGAVSMFSPIQFDKLADLITLCLGASLSLVAASLSAHSVRIRFRLWIKSFS